MATVCERERAEKEVDVFLAMALHLSPVKPNAPNFVFSPLTLRVLLSICAAGSNAPTAEQLLSYLKSDSVEELNAFSKELFSNLLAKSTYRGAPKISLANGVWVHQDLSLKQSFKQVLDQVYKADLHISDFTTQAGEIVSEVNSWAKDKTDGLIREIMPRGSISEIDRLVLTNALYFKGEWSTFYFSPASGTKEDDFHLLDGDSVKVPFMTSNRLYHSIGIFDDFKVLRIYYKQGDNKTMLCMYILLPNSVDGLAALAERVSSEPDFLDHHLSSKHVEYRLINDGMFKIPKFKFSFGFEASDALKELGVTLPFQAGALSEMVDHPEEGQESFLRNFHQKTFIEVDEKGTVAASVTVVLRGGGEGPKIPPEKVDFVADHPFMFLVREDTSGAVLFLGHCNGGKLIEPEKG